MSKIICDVCGTSYPETSDQCPICGCVRPVDVQGVMEDSDSDGAKSGYTYVKGGRFSKANVKKRVQSSHPVGQEISVDNEPEEKERKGGSIALIATAVVLLLAIVAVIIYITIRFFGIGGNLPEQTQPSTTVSTTEAVIACTKLTVPEQTVQLSEAGSAWLLNPTKEPADTTDVITFSSSDETVATVTEKGKITAISNGQAVITITCGSQTVECRVICDIPETTEETVEESTGETTDETTEETPGDTTYTEEDIIFTSRYNPPEATLHFEGEEWNCYKGNIPVNEITWKSDNESVAVVKNGVITAVGEGKTTIHAIWGDFDMTCKVICRFFTTPTGIAGSDNVSEDG